LVLTAFAAVSLWVVAVNLWYAHAHGVVWLGVDSEFPGDMMGYLAWIQDASRHVLASDLFVPWATVHDWLQPMVVISGGLVALGTAPWVALLLWKPVAVLAVVVAARAYCRRTLPGRWDRRAALVLALFAASLPVVGDEWLPFISWGYVFALMAVATLVGALVCYDRARSDLRISWLAPALGLLTSWLHPWQGEILLLIIAGAEVVGLHGSLGSGIRRRLGLAALTMTGTALPLAYYALLDRLDSEWRIGHAVTTGQWPLRTVLLPLAPLLLPAALAYIRRPRSFLELTTRVWPLATLAAWALNNTRLGGWSVHSWTGITIPLAILAVQGIRNVGFDRLPARRWLAAVAVGALTVPATVYMMNKARTVLVTNTASKQRALTFLASNPHSGSVLTDFANGTEIPAETGRRTYVSGLRIWTEPGAGYRANAAQRLFDGPSWWSSPRSWRGGPPPSGQLTDEAARAFVLSTGARFVLQNCGSRANLWRSLRPIVRATHRFGCTTVYEISPPRMF
jgi:hypothetical protein